MNPTTIRPSAILALALAAGTAVAQQEPLTADQYRAQAEAALQQAQAESAAKDRDQSNGTAAQQEAIAKKRAAGEAAAAAAAAAAQQAAALRGGANQPGGSTAPGPGGTIITQPGQGPGVCGWRGATGRRRVRRRRWRRMR